jgi:hypothetical protein
MDYKYICLAVLSRCLVPSQTLSSSLEISRRRKYKTTYKQNSGYNIYIANNYDIVLRHKGEIGDPHTHFVVQ